MLCALAAACCAEGPASVGGPVTGFVFDAQAGGIRPMLGIPGAAYLGSALVSRVESASVAPDGSAALATQGGRLTLYTGLRGAKPTGVAINGGLSGADRFAWAPDGSAAAVYSSKSGIAQILTGLAKNPTAGTPFAFPASSGSVTAMVFDGKRVIFGAASDGAGGIYVATAEAPAQRIATAAKPSAIALAGADLYFADSDAQQIREVKSYALTPAVVTFADDPAISAPAGLQLSADGKRLYAANAGNRKLAVYDVASRSVIQSLDLSCTPTRLDRFGSASAFLMNGTGEGPLYVVSDSAQPPAVYFVPVPAGKARKIRIRPL